jgi:hypothetical protein
MRIVPLVIVAAIATFGRDAFADNKHLCCTPEQGGACVAQAGPCSVPAPYGVDLDDLSPDAGADLSPLDTQASFPDGKDGYVWWSTATPRLGLCLVAPSADDPTHTQPTEPIGCIQVSIGGGLGAAGASYTFAAGPWDAFEFCYGPELPGVGQGAQPQFTADGKPAVCAGINDLLDPTVAPTPSGSCCEPAEMLTTQHMFSEDTWTISIGQEIPGVPPNQIVFNADGGGIKAYPDPTLGDYIGPLPADQCLAVYNEPQNCGWPPADPAAFPGPDGGVAGDPPSQGGGGCSVGAPQGAPSGAFALAAVCAMVLARRARRG